MNRKKILLILCLCMLFSGLGMSSKVHAGSDSNYSRIDAANYAEKWALSYNTNKYYDAGLDCTNFVSQCLVAGGKKKSSTLPSYDNINYWRPHSATWENANYFKKYWIKKVVSAGKNISSLNQTGKDNFSSKLYSELFRGDVVQYGYGSDDMRHSQICHAYGTSSTGYGTLLMAQHTDNRKNIALHDYVQSTYYSYIRYYKMKETK